MCRGLFKLTIEPKLSVNLGLGEEEKTEFRLAMKSGDGDKAPV